MRNFFEDDSSEKEIEEQINKKNEKIKEQKIEKKERELVIRTDNEVEYNEFLEKKKKGQMLTYSMADKLRIALDKLSLKNDSTSS